MVELVKQCCDSAPVMIVNCYKSGLAQCLNIVLYFSDVLSRMVPEEISEQGQRVYWAGGGSRVIDRDL